MEFKNVENHLINFCKQNDIKVNDNILENLRTYYHLLIEWNEKINLTAITNLTDVYEKHFEDSLLAINLIKQNAYCCDIGTGAGFPGLVIAIFRPDIKMVLVDALQKRVNFLKLVIEKLNLNNVKVLHNRAEDEIFKQQYLNSFNIVVSRAVARLNTLLEYCLPFVKTSGQLIAYKSEKTEEEIKESSNALKILGGGNIKKLEYYINNTYRTLLIINKIIITNSKYPRNQNKPKLKPL